MLARKPVKLFHPKGRAGVANAIVARLAQVVILSLALIAAAPRVGQAQTNTVTLFPVADSYVVNGSGVAANYGTDIELKVKAGNPTRVAYLKFDMSLINSPIISATFQMYGGNSSTSAYSGADTLYGVSDSTWTETGIAYDNMPALGAAISSSAITATQQFYSWDASSYVQGAATSGNPLITLALNMNQIPANGSSDVFMSKEGALIPRLVLVLSPGSGPSSLNAAPANGQVSLSWPSVTDAVTYNIYRSSTSGSSFSQIGSCSTTGYTDSTSVTGSSYLYYVTAIVNGLETSPSPTSTAALTVGTILSPTADAYIQDGTDAGTNFGTSTSLMAKLPGSNPYRRTFMKFDLSQITGTVQSAKLLLYGANNSPSGYTGSDSIYQVPNSSWTETGINWNNAPTFGGSKISSATVTSTPQWCQWDLTSLIQSAASSGSGIASLGLCMDQPTPNHQGDIFNSREASTNRPQLVIVQTPPAAPVLSASPGNGQVYLSWNASTPTGSYEVLRSTTAGGPYTQLSTTVGDGYLDTSVLNGATYYYVVFASTSGGTSVYSNEASVTPTSPSTINATTPAISVSPTSITFQQVITLGPSATQNVTITNTGFAGLTIASGGLTLSGINSADFDLISPPTLPLTLSPGQSVVVGVALNSTSIGNKSAILDIASNDPNVPLVPVLLTGITLGGTTPTNEPSLQDLFNAFGIGVNTGVADGTVWPTTAPLGDEVIVPQFVKAGSGLVTVQAIAEFSSHDKTTQVSCDFGYYQSGQPTTAQQLFYTPYASFYTIYPQEIGATSFDPGSGRWGVTATFPRYATTVYQEDALNVFAGDSTPHHVRVYPYKDANGVIVPNTYIVVFAEGLPSKDYNDLVVVLRNVMPATNTGTVDTQNLDGLPAKDRFVFNRIGGIVSTCVDAVHDTDTCRILNTGASPLSINSLTVAGPWYLPNSPTLPASIPAGGYLDVPIKFVATSGRLNYGSLTIGSNDSVTPSKVVTLAGFWQCQGEFEPYNEPTPQEVINGLFGYQTIIVYPGQTWLETEYFENLIGEEILAPYWTALDPTKPVTIRQLSSDHTYPNTEDMCWFPQTTLKVVTIFTMDGNYAQALLPPLVGLTTPAQGSFTPTPKPTSVFGFRIGKRESSVDSFNNPPPGHNLRFYPQRDGNGNLVPGSYLMYMDYSEPDGTVGNFDFNDNIYLFSNIQPVN